MEQQPLSGSQQKVLEYIERIKNGESKDSIMEGLPPSFVSSIEAGLNESKKEVELIAQIDTAVDNSRDETEMRRKKLSEEIEIEEIRKRLGINSDEAVATKQQELASAQNNERGENHLIAGLIKLVSQGRKQVVIDLYKNLFDNIDDSENRRSLVSALFQDVYTRYRSADYPADSNGEKLWEEALNNKKVPIDNRKKEWMYRGIFPKKGEETVTRGSFNVNVTPELINTLDEMILSGKIKANYKFGEPGTPTSPTDRHDSISIYFLEQPSDEALEELAQTIKPYVRGDNLLGKKVADGFFMSEIGSIETEHIESFVEELKSKDPAFAEALKRYTNPKPGSGDSRKMSEAQYYAVKDVARAFGYNISYNKDIGFEIK